MQNKTTEFSFILKPSKHGIDIFAVGVFATENIKKNTHLKLFGDGETIDLRSSIRKKKDVPTIFHGYCMDRGDELICPNDFGHMHIGWFLNHSNLPNTYPDSDYKWYASQNIKAGEEIVIDYNSLDEPSAGKGDYYK